MSRSDALMAFVQSSDAAGAEIHMLAGDASFRKYWRVLRGGQSWVVMDAPPEYEDVRPFVAVTKLLSTAGLCVPKLYAEDSLHGFLLLEDLGDALYSQFLAAEPRNEAMLYEHACENLVRLHQFSQQKRTLAQALPHYDDAIYLREVALFTDWFLVQVVGKEQAKLLQAPWQKAWREVLALAGLARDTIVHRDFHADNLLWLPTRENKVGMLDYQDALLGDPLYDVISLLEDARRDVTISTVDACKHYMQTSSGIDKDDFSRRYHVLAAQRNAKIIGIFARLCVRDGKAKYLEYLPRVWAHFMRDLSHPALAPVAGFIQQHVPENYRGTFTPDSELGGL